MTSRLSKNYFYDYIGLLSGYYVEFEAKETEKEYFNLNNIKKHQISKLIKVNENNGLAFILVYFHLFEKLYVLDINTLVEFKNKKIPHQYFQDNLKEISISGISFNFSNLINHLINYT